VSPQQFKQAKTAGQLLVASFGSGTMVGFGQFSSTFKQEQDITSDLNLIQTKHEGIGL